MDIAGYHGWNIYSYDGDIIAVTDQDDHSVAISNVLSIDVRVDKHWYYKDGESIEFRDDYFNIGERAKTNGMIFVQSILVTYYGLNLELGR